MSPIREQNRRLALRGLGLALRSRFFWGVVAATLVVEFFRTNPDLGQFLLQIALLLTLIALAAVFLRAIPGGLWTPWDPEWSTYWETRRVRREIEELRRELRRRKGRE
jgi:hypothetical protein